MSKLPAARGEKSYPVPAPELDGEPVTEPLWWPSPSRRLARTGVLTLAATALTFALIPPSGPDSIPPVGPWPARFLDWLSSLLTLGFLDGRRDPNSAFAMFRVPYSVAITVAVASTAATTTALIALAGPPGRRPTRLPRAWSAAFAMVGIGLLAWLTGTLSAVAGRLNEAAGTTVLPTVVVTPSVRDFAEPVRLLHQLVFPALVLTVALAPAGIWWLRRRWAAINREGLGVGPGHALRGLSELLPVFVAAALLVEVATYSFGASQLLTGRPVQLWFEDRASNVATGLLLLAAAVAVFRWLMDTAGNLMISRLAAGPGEELDGERQPEPAETASQLWHRIRSDRTARIAVSALATLAVAVSYSQLWFDFGPGDIVSTDAPRPPSARHWLGVDMFGHDHLVRLGAAAAGSVAIAAGAATLAISAGLALLIVAAFLPRRSSLLIADLVAVAAVVWLLRSFGDPLFHSTDLAVSRVELAVALGAMGLSVAIRHLPDRWEDPIVPFAAAWLVTCAAAIAAEALATTLLVQLDGRAPSLGESLATTASGAFLIKLGLSAPTPPAWPWLWHPPAVLTAILAAAFVLLAVAVLRGPDPPT